MEYSINGYSDNGPQFMSQFKKCAEMYGFQHVYSNPYFPQLIGEAERGVQTIKNLMKKTEDPYLAFMMHHATPLQNESSLSELVLIRTTVPKEKENFQARDIENKNERQSSSSKRCSIFVSRTTDMGETTRHSRHNSPIGNLHLKILM